VISGLRIRPGQSSDVDVVKSWLASAGLPTEDLTADHMQGFLVAEVDGDAAGAIGLEQLGDIGLLRSLVVDPSRRSGGIGAHLVAALEQKAAAAGIRQLWLLTIDADRYFVNLGWTVSDRADAPPAIRATQEFSSLCPGDAVVMSKG